MNVERPDLSHLEEPVRSYIESLEAEVARLSRKKTGRHEPEPMPEEAAVFEPGEAPTTWNVITMTAGGLAKRTPRHLYSRQRRGGMGVFDLEAPEEDPPCILAIADEKQSLLLFTNMGRAFRSPVASLPESPVRSRGQPGMARSALEPGERLVSALPDLAKGSVALVSQRGMVRVLRHHVFGEYMRPGTSLFDTRQFGELAAACWTSGEQDLFIATRLGHAIRFPEKLTPPQGGPGIRLEGKDTPVGIAGVDDQSSVFLIAEDGRGTIRPMSGFHPNKSAGGSGKIAMSSEALAGVIEIESYDDIFILSELSKIIRFRAEETPSKEGVVQGVNCMALRNDRTVAVAASKAYEK